MIGTSRASSRARSACVADDGVFGAPLLDGLTEADRLEDEGVIVFGAQVRLLRGHGLHISAQSRDRGAQALADEIPIQSRRGERRSTIPASGLE
jgi:hypothetical protein